MIPLCEKYRAECFLDVRGQEYAITRLKNYVKSFPFCDKRTILLHGPSGTGKTSLAHSLASEIKAEILELNASDLRNKEKIISILGAAAEQKSLFAKKKIILVDEINGITHEDKGGLPELLVLIEKTHFPIIITANNIWQSKFNLLRQKSELVQLKELKYYEILEIIKTIAKKENIKIHEDLLTKIAINAKGDVRAAINDLQAVSSLEKPELEVIKEITIDERNKEEDIFNVLRFVFKNTAVNEILNIYDSLNMPLNEVFLWLEENIPQEYSGSELEKAFNALSLADVFRGRIHRQQYWRFLVYENLFLSAGVSVAKKKIKTDFTIYKKPTRVLKIWLSNQRNEKKKSIIEKYAKATHCSKKRANKEFKLLPYILNEQAREQLKLNEDESLFLQEFKNK